MALIKAVRGTLSMAGLSMVAIVCISAGIEAGSRGPNPIYTADPSGVLGTYRTTGGVDLSNYFFQSLGSNRRSCSSCHVAEDGWTVTPRHIQARFLASRGKDPIFRLVDGAVCPSADDSSLKAKQSAYSLLLKKGLIRVSIAVPDGADLSITAIQDPYNCPEITAAKPALYRRPLPATNLAFDSAVMWDGRETVHSGTTLDLNASLSSQAFDATMGHAEASKKPTNEQIAEIVAFEKANFTAQAAGIRAGLLTGNGAQGGPRNLSQQQFYVGINDAFGGDPQGMQFNPNVFTIYNNWMSSPSAYRRSVARGEEIFNTYPIHIKDVGGLPDMQGTCTTCHDSPNVGNHSFSVPLAIGTSDYPALAPLDVSGLPVYTVQCSDGTTKHVTDLGRALISRSWPTWAR
jgi:cytochrome c peroxidase